MPVVTEVLDLPDGTTPRGVRVIIQLAGTDGDPIAGFVGTTSLVGKLEVPVRADGAYTVTLPGAADITPSGSRWKRTVVLPKGPSPAPEYLLVPSTGGPYRVDQILDEAPASVASSALTQEIARAVAAEAALTAAVAAVEASDVDSVNSRTGTVTGLAEQADLTAEVTARTNAVAAEVTNRNTAIAAAVAVHAAATDPHGDRAYTDSRIATILGGVPPVALDTVIELANQMLADEGVVVTLTTLVGTKETPAGAQAKADAAQAAALVAAAALVDDLSGVTNAPLARTALGLGTAALVNTGTSGANVPTITQADARYTLAGTCVAVAGVYALTSTTAETTQVTGDAFVRSTRKADGTLYRGDGTAAPRLFSKVVDQAANAITTYGIGALEVLTSGIQHSALGFEALAKVTSGNYDTALGYRALNKLTTASYCVAVGQGAAENNLIGDAITAIGFHTLQASTGGSNTGVGRNAGVTIVDGFNNSLLGDGADCGASTQYAVAVGSLAIASGNGAIAIGVQASATANGSAAFGRDSSGTAASTSTVNEIALGTANHSVKVAGTLKPNAIQMIGTAVLSMATSDGTDNGILTISGGGGTGANRGGAITVYGNQAAGQPGNILLVAGDREGAGVSKVFLAAYDSGGTYNNVVIATGDALTLGKAGKTIGFYGGAGSALQTGVAVTAAAIHAALVALNLITA